MYYLGVDVGGTNIAVGIVDENNAIIAKASHPTLVPCSEDAFCDAILAVCNDALAKAGLTLDDVPWIGIGCPGTVNRATGIIEFANNLYFKNFKLRDMMAEVPPYIFVKHIYACASIVGAIVCVYTYRLFGVVASLIFGSAAVILMRYLAAHYRWNLPKLK